MELRGYIDVLRRRWLFFILLPLIAGISAFVISRQITPIYAATSTLLVNQTQQPGVVQYNDVLTSERLTNTYAELVTRRPVLSQVITAMSLPYNEGRLESKLSVSAVRNTQLLRVRVEDPSPGLSAAMANAIAQAFIDDNSRQLGRPGTVSIIDLATVPGAPVKPDTSINVALALVLGLVLAGGLVLVQEYLDDTVKTPEDVETVAGTSTLGVVSRFKGARAPLSETVGSLHSEAGEAYRQIRTGIQFSGLDGKLKTILVTSANPGEGKSTTIANLASVLAQTGQKVILVDTDLRRPTLHTVFKVPNSFGLTGILLSDAADPAPGLVATRIKNLMLLPSGPIPPNPSELLASKPMESLIAGLKSRADYVLFDSPPVLAVADASILASKTDGTVLVLEMGHARSEALRRVARALSKVNARLIGAVINKARERGHGYYYYGYYRHDPGVDPNPPSGGPVEPQVIGTNQQSGTAS
jgi:non-specific protein-tyrosine kinase